MNSRLFIDAVNFATNYAPMQELLQKRDGDPNLILMSVSCVKGLYEDSDNDYFLRVMFDYKIRNRRNTPGPDVFIDLEYEDGKFRVLPKP